MNTGAVVTRYAKALLKYVQQTGRGQEVCDQVRALLADPHSAATMQLEPDLQRFISLLSEHSRLEYMKPILRSFVGMYFKSAGIVPATLRTAVPVDGLSERVTALLEKQTGRKVILETSVDERLIGGFVIEVDDKMLDASVKHQLDLLRRQFVIENNRLV